MLETRHFDDLFLCWQPGAHDIEILLERIQHYNSGRRRSARILIVSDEGRPEYVMAMLDHGINAYIVRPFSREIILRHMCRLLKSPASSDTYYL